MLCGNYKSQRTSDSDQRTEDVYKRQNRAFVNAAFVTMALQSGLTMAIANPSSDIMMNLAAASDLLLNKAGADLNYINRMAEFDAKKKLNL